MSTPLFTRKTVGKYAWRPMWVDAPNDKYLIWLHPYQATYELTFKLVRGQALPKLYWKLISRSLLDE